MAWKDIERNAVNPIGKRKFSPVIVVATDDDEVTLALNNLVRGTITKIIFEVPALAGASGTAILKIVDEDSKVLYTSGALAEGTDHTIPVAEDVTGEESWYIITDAAQSADTTFVVKVVYQ